MQNLFWRFELKFTDQACNKRYEKCKICKNNNILNIYADLTHCELCHKKIKKTAEPTGSSGGVGYAHAECNDRYLFESGHTKALSRNWSK